MRPKIGIEVFKKSFQLEKEERLYCEAEDGIFVFASATGKAELNTEEKLLDAYNSLRNVDGLHFADWPTYRALRTKFHIVEPCEFWQGYLDKKYP